MGDKGQIFLATNKRGGLIGTSCCGLQPPF